MPSIKAVMPYGLDATGNVGIHCIAGNLLPFTTHAMNCLKQACWLSLSLVMLQSLQFQNRSQSGLVRSAETRSSSLVVSVITEPTKLEQEHDRALSDIQSHDRGMSDFLWLLLPIKATR